MAKHKAWPMLEGLFVCLFFLWCIFIHLGIVFYKAQISPNYIQGKNDLVTLPCMTYFCSFTPILTTASWKIRDQTLIEGWVVSIDCTNDTADDLRLAYLTRKCGYMINITVLFVLLHGYSFNKMASFFNEYTENSVGLW